LEPPPTPSSRVLKAHVSDESTVLNEELQPPCESVADSCSSSASICGSSGSIAHDIQKKGRPGRRQKARQRQLEWEEASRAAFHEAQTSGISPGSGDTSWAFGALTSVFEDLMVDEFEAGGFDVVGGGEPSYGSASLAETDDIIEHGRHKWQHPLQSENFLDAHAEALRHIPPAITASYCEYRRVALDAQLDTVISLKRSILSLTPCVESLEAARRACEHWSGPDSLKASWSYMHSFTLEKPSRVLHQLQECYHRVANASEDASRQSMNELDYMQEDLYDCLENSVTAFTDDLKLFRFCLDRDEAKSLQPDPIHTPLPRKESELQTAERNRVQGMSRDELQALLASKPSGK